MRLPPFLRFVLCLSVLYYLFYPTLLWMVVSWKESTYYSHALWVILSAVLAGIVQSRKPVSEKAKNSKEGLIWIAIGLVVVLLGSYLGLNALKAWGAISLVWASAVLFLKEKRLVGLRPILILIACIVPIPFLPSVLAWLQRTAVSGSVGLLGMVGLPAEVAGSLVQFSNGQEILVGEACSGLKSILVLFALTLLGGYLFPFGTFLRWILALLSLPVAWMSNLFRVTLVLGIGAKRGADSALAFWDASAGFLFYGTSLVVMTGLWAILSRIRQRAVLLFLVGSFWALNPTEQAWASAPTYHTNFTDTNAYLFTSHQGRWWTRSDFFHDRNIAKLPYRLGPWEGEDVPIDDPLPLFLRLYEHEESGIYLYLQPVFGREESAFHTAEVCYIDAGWKMEHRGYETLNVNGRPLSVRYATAEIEDHRHLILYWYAWPNARRVITDGALMFRISVEVDEGGDKEAELAAVDFIEELSRARFGGDPPAPPKPPQPDLTVWRKALKERSHNSYKELSSNLRDFRDKATQWLSDQIVPNSIVRRPAYARRNIVLSYRVDPASQGYRYTFSKAALYDNALAAIALTMAGHRDKASAILDALERVSSRDGDLFFTFNTHNVWPNALDEEGAIVRTGASAWFGYALTFYLAHALLNDPNLFSKNPDAFRYLQFAERTAERLLIRQVKVEGDPRFGLLTGGKGRYVLKLKEGKVKEEFVPGEVEWCSVEHNIDAYYFYRDLSRITGEKRWEEVSSELKNSLLGAAWSSELGQFNRGVRKSGGDPFPALDCASWGSILLKNWGENKKASLAAKRFKKYRSKDKGIWGYKPYAAGPIYEFPTVQTFFYPTQGEGVWENFSMVWPEGSLGAGLSFWRLGNRKKAEEILSEMMRLRDKDGGIPYSTQDIEFQFTTAPSVASAAWTVILASTLEDPVADVLFWGP